ncbi:MAG: TM2 domain-containing protein [Gemmatimonadales bacterium]
MADDDLFASPKSRTVAFILALVLGVFGAHRFYAGKVGSGILQLCTLGGLGLWWLYDVIVIASGSFRDAEGRLISNWEPESEHLVTSGTAAEILDELDALRAEVSHMQERVDFVERLLANPDRGETPLQ